MNEDLPPLGVAAEIIHREIINSDEVRIELECKTARAAFFLGLFYSQRLNSVVIVTKEIEQGQTIQFWPGRQMEKGEDL